MAVLPKTEKSVLLQFGHFTLPSAPLPTHLFSGLSHEESVLPNWLPSSLHCIYSSCRLVHEKLLRRTVISVWREVSRYRTQRWTWVRSPVHTTDEAQVTGSTLDLKPRADVSSRVFHKTVHNTIIPKLPTSFLPYYQKGTRQMKAATLKYNPLIPNHI